MSSVVDKEADETADKALIAEAATVAQLQAARATIWVAGAKETVECACYKLIGCPEVPKANYVLTKPTASGELAVLEIGRVENRAASLNLAHIRQTGANLGATEVHIHIPNGGIRARRRIERRLKSAAAADQLTSHAS